MVATERQDRISIGRRGRLSGRQAHRRPMEASGRLDGSLRMGKRGLCTRVPRAFDADPDGEEQVRVGRAPGSGARPICGGDVGVAPVRGGTYRNGHVPRRSAIVRVSVHRLSARGRCGYPPRERPVKLPPRSRRVLSPKHPRGRCDAGRRQASAALLPCVADLRRAECPEGFPGAGRSVPPGPCIARRESRPRWQRSGIKC